MTSALRILECPPEVNLEGRFGISSHSVDASQMWWMGDLRIREAYEQCFETVANLSKQDRSRLFSRGLYRSILIAIRDTAISLLACTGIPRSL